MRPQANNHLPFYDDRTAGAFNHGEQSPGTCPEQAHSDYPAQIQNVRPGKEDL